MRGGGREPVAQLLYSSEASGGMVDAVAAAIKHHFGLTSRWGGDSVWSRSQIRVGCEVGHPNQGRDAGLRVRCQLDVRACPTWPLRSFAFGERLTFERVVEVDVLR